MTSVKLAELIEFGDQHDTFAREVLLVHARHAGTETCASCGRCWPCDRAIDARRYVEYWQGERPQLEQRYAAVPS